MSPELPLTRRLALPALLVLLALVVTGCQSASDSFDGFQIASSYTLQSGEQRAGDQVILAAASAVADLLADLVDQAQAFTGESVLLGAVFAGVAAVTIAWLGVIWRLMGGRNALPRRSKL